MIHVKLEPTRVDAFPPTPPLRASTFLRRSTHNKHVPHVCVASARTQPLLEQQVTNSQGEVDDMYQPITPDDLVRKEWTEKAKVPDDVMATLLPYQAEG